jgi:hypothetical protein
MDQYADYLGTYRQLQGLRSTAPLVVSIDKKTRYTEIWSQLLTLAAWSKRDGRALFCLTEGSWELSFHPEARCTAQQIDSGLHMLVTATWMANVEVEGRLDGIQYVRTQR